MTVFVMVGLPGRGKSYIARKLARYLRWCGQRTQVFNVGSYRRERLGAGQSHEFFDPDNEDGRRAREQLAISALEDMFQWFDGGGEVAVYDATNSTRRRRTLVLERCQVKGHQVVFIESMCNDPAIVEANVRATKLRSPDYEGVSEQFAVHDFYARLAHYERAYQPLQGEGLSFVRIVDAGRQVVVNRIDDVIAARAAVFLMNLRPIESAVWLTRHGESNFNRLGRIGGDSDLTARGAAYAVDLSGWFASQPLDPGSVTVWTSTMQRALQTAKSVCVAPPLCDKALSRRALDEIDGGICDGLTYEEIRERMPDEFDARAADKFRYRYPRGESYQDVIQRLEPLIIELERTADPLLIVGHQAVLRALYAYLIDEPPERCPWLSIPLHTLIEVQPNAYGFEERAVPFDVPQGAPQSG